VSSNISKEVEAPLIIMATDQIRMAPASRLVRLIRSVNAPIGRVAIAPTAVETVTSNPMLVLPMCRSPFELHGGGPDAGLVRGIQCEHAGQQHDHPEPGGATHHITELVPHPVAERVRRPIEVPTYPHGAPELGRLSVPVVLIADRSAWWAVVRDDCCRAAPLPTRSST